MSESERKKRLEYRKKRRRVLFTQTIIAVLLGVAIAISSIVYFRANKNYYVSYNEEYAIDYKVYLKPNNNFENDYVGKDQSYIASIIDYVDVDFDYDIDLDSKWAEYKYNYKIDAEVTIKDNTNKKNIFFYAMPLKEKAEFVQYGSNKLSVSDNVIIYYDDFNDFANEFKEIYGLSDVSCFVNVVLTVDVDGACEEIKNANFGSRRLSLNIPLTQKTIAINMVSSIPTGKKGSFVCETCFNNEIFKDIALGAFGVEIVVLLTLLIYAYATRNHDIVYEIKIKKLVYAYRSYIQKILNEFCYDGYQVVNVETFNQMLDIRDTINSPILMSENADKTCTTFLIPTNNNIVYVHEIKVEDYDEIYANLIYDNEPIVENTTETVEDVVVETVATEIEQENKVEEIKDVEENLVPLQYQQAPSYNYSFEAKLHLSNEHTRDYYEEISAFVQSYGLKLSRSWDKERIQVGKKTYAIISFKGLKLVVSFALNPADFADTKYNFIDASSTKKFVQFPAQMKITSLRKVNWVKELISSMAIKDGVENKNLEVKSLKIKPKTKNKLIKENLIKVK